MILKEISPMNWGPFDERAALLVEPDVTVITAPNDAGKSSILRLLNVAFCYPQVEEVQEGDLNVDYLENGKYDRWENVVEFGCRLKFTADKRISEYIRVNGSKQVIEEGDEVRVALSVAPEVPGVTVDVFKKNGGPIRPEVLSLIRLPSIIMLPTQHEISNVINVRSANDAEKLLLEVAFGHKFDADKIARYNRGHYSKAQTRLDTAFARVMPQSLNLSLHIDKGENTGEVRVLLIDNEYGTAPLSSRGSGIRLLISLLSSLLQAQSIHGHLIICIDEPEISLHADAQHLLRSLLEELARQENTQVIYATHSPAMINNMRPRSVRLLKRVLETDRVTTQIDNRPIDNNFLQIRTSLGMSPSDSLQFAPVSIVVEGASEAIGIQLLLDKLYDFGVEGFEDVPLITPLCHIIDGEGETYIKQAKFALSQKSQVVVFLDGDKKVAKKTREVLKDVPFIQITNNQEIEQLISTHIYFDAIKQSHEEQGIESTGIEFTFFLTWLVIQPDRIQRAAFSKKVDAWLDEVSPRFSYVKPRVLRLAIDLVESADQIAVEELKQLVAEVKRKLPSKA